MSFWFAILTILFIGVSVAMVLIILVQRPQGGGLAGAFGGASGGGTDSAFGGRTGDALTAATVATFVVYLVLALGLNIIDNRRLLARPGAVTTTGAASPADGSTPEGSTEGDATGDGAATGSDGASTPSSGAAGSTGATGSTGSTGSTSGDAPATPPPSDPAK